MSEKWGKLTKEESVKATYWGEREESCSRYEKDGRIIYESSRLETGLACSA